MSEAKIEFLVEGARNNPFVNIVEKYFWPFVSIIVVLVLWELLALSLPSHEFPRLFELVRVMYDVYLGESARQPRDHIPITLTRITIAFLMSMTIGVSIGIAMGINSLIEDFASVYVVVAMAFPSIVWAFLLTLWFGLTDYLTPVLAAFFVGTPYVIINIWKGMNDLDVNLVLMADSFGSGSWMKWRYIYLYHLLPFIFSTMRITLSLSWKVMLIAEIFGSSKGVGKVVQSAFITQNNDVILAWAIPIMFLMYLIERVIHRVELRMFDWRPKMDTELTMR